MGTHNICFHAEYYVDTIPYLKLRISIWKRAKIRMNIFSTNWLLADISRFYKMQANSQHYVKDKNGLVYIKEVLINSKLCFLL